MDQKDLERCRQVSVVLTPLQNSEIKKWKNQRKTTKKRRNRWQNGSLRKPTKSRSRKLSAPPFNVQQNGARLKDSGVQPPEDNISNVIPSSRIDETKELDLDQENDTAFCLWKYKRKRRMSSDSSGAEPTTSKVTINSADSAFSSKELTINVSRLRAQAPSRGVLCDDESEVDADSYHDAASLIMDSCEDSYSRAPGVKSQEFDDKDDDKADRLITSTPQFDNCNSDGAPSDDDNESDNDEELMDLCLMQEPTVVVTKLEDIIIALDNNNYFPDRKHLTPKHLDIIRGFKTLDESEDSYCLVMSSDTEELDSNSTIEYGYADEDDEKEDDDDDDSFINTVIARRVRNRRRISSSGSSSLEHSPQTTCDDVVEENGRETRGNSHNVEIPSTPSMGSKAASVDDEDSNLPETLLTNPLSCEGCKETFDTVGGVLSHTCAPALPKKVKSKNRGMKIKKHAKLAPKSTSLECTLCSQTFKDPELLQRHLWSHTQREHEEAFKAAKRQSRGKETEHNAEIVTSVDADPEGKSESVESNQPGIAIMNEKSSKGKINKTAVPVVICPCHVDDLKPTDLTVQIEMVLFCDICRVLFRRSECFETHYRSNALCNKDRRKGRSPTLFCSTCRVILSNLSDMRKHLEKHVSINRHGTVTFVCNICRVVFFGVGTVFCTHWFNHEKDPMFVASRYSFPKLCVSSRGKNPIGKQPDEQYFFVAEYVCRSCKQQFSSDGDLLNHMRECKGMELKQSSLAKEPPKEKPKNTPPPPAPEPPKKPIEKIKFNVITKSQMTSSTRGSPQRRTVARSSPSRSAINKHPPPRPVPPSTANPRTAPLPIAPKPAALTPQPQSALVQRPQAQRWVQIRTIQRLAPKPPDFKGILHFYVKTWICDICGGVFRTRQSLVEKHAFSHFDATIALEKFNKTVDRSYACTICRKAYESLEALNKHWLNHELVNYSCATCNNTYHTISGYIRHIVAGCRNQNSTCRVSFRTSALCKLCCLGFKNDQDLATHNVDYHAVGRIVASRGADQIQPPSSSKSLNGARKLSPIAPKTPQSAVILSSTDSDQSSGLVVGVQPQNNNDDGVSQAVNGSVVLNIAIPNVVQNEQTSPSKGKAPEDPTVQVVLPQADESESIPSPALVTHMPSVKTMEMSRGLNSSTIALTVRDTTATGASVIERNSPVEEESISSGEICSLVQNQTPDCPSSGEGEKASEDTEVPKATDGMSNGDVEDTPENGTTDNTDDVEIVEVKKCSKKLSNSQPSLLKDKQPSLLKNKQPSLLKDKQPSLLKLALTTTDSDIEILSEASAPEEPEKSSGDTGTADKSEKTQNREESSESGESVTIAKKPLGFLRVKNLSELQDENKNRQDYRASGKTGNTLTEHLMANLKQGKSSTKHQSIANGINSGGDDGGAGMSSPHVPGRRFLPNIPQRVQGNEARRATPLSTRQDCRSRGPAKPMNRVTPIPTSNSGIATAHYNRPMNPPLYGTLNVDGRQQGSVNQGGMTQNTYGQRQLQGQNKYKCLVCSAFETDSPGEFQKHFSTHSQQMLSSTIQNCNISYSQQLGTAVNSMYEQYQYQGEMMPLTTGIIQSGQLYKCNYCTNCQFSSYEGLAAHVQAVHGNITNVPSRLVCPICPTLNLFDSEMRLREHQEAEHMFLCPICMQIFHSSYELSAHSNLHKSD
ncbi:uncharacterized protein LOC135163046 isoform X2 [Diachasmimorpha longicaudata]|uniref:uncharacterized protein LOC135163046 isoform X2 n=1 Tax=Diachasmimorpha longicaudata TaxID=58733 RepID=UPI0030B8C19B